MNNSLKVKVTSEVQLEMLKKVYDYETIVYGKMSIGKGKGHKRMTLDFIWNMSLDAYPIIKDRAYNKTEVDQLAGMIMFYDNLRQEIK